MFSLFSKADAYLGAFEQEYAFRYNLLGNFNKLYCLLKNEMGNQIGEAFKSLEKAEETEDEQWQANVKDRLLKKLGYREIYSGRFVAVYRIDMDQKIIFINHIADTQMDYPNLFVERHID